MKTALLLRRVAVFCAAALLLAGCGRPKPPPSVADRPLLVVASLYWPGNYWIDVARDKDWFRAAGLNVKFTDTNADFIGSLQDVIAGRLHTQGIALFDVMALNAAGADLVMIVCTDQSAGADGIVARKGIDTLADLRGKRVGIPKGSYSAYILATLLQRERLTAKDFTSVDIQAERVPAALAARQVDAAITWEPFLSEASALGAHSIWDSSEMPGISPAGLTLRRALITERPKDVQALVEVWRRATEFLLQRPDEASEIVARTQKKSPAEVRALLAKDKVLDLRESLAAFSFAQGFESLHGSARVMSKFLVHSGLPAAPLDSTRFLDAQFLKALTRKEP